VATAEAAEINPATAHIRKQDPVLWARQAGECLERFRLQRHGAVAEPCLRALEPAVGIRASHVDDAGPAIDVARLESEELRWPQSGRGGEDDNRPVHRTEPCGDRFNLLPRIERELLLARRGVFRMPHFAGLESSRPQSTARFRTCRSAWVASKRWPSGIVSRHAYTSFGDSAASRVSPSVAVALASSQRSLAIVTASAWCSSRYSSTNSASVIVVRLPRLATPVKESRQPVYGARKMEAR